MAYQRLEPGFSAGGRLRLWSCAGDLRESSRIAAQRVGGLQKIKMGNHLVMDLGVATDFHERTRLVKQKVKPLDLIGETTDLVD